MSNKTLEMFMRSATELDKPRVLELGTLRSIESRSTLHADWIPNASEWLGVDIQAGPDVDIVADVHSLSEVVGIESADAVVSCSTFEHLKYPFLAAHEIMKVLKVGGLLFVQTHQTFPIHAYPCDFFRFSTDALAALFGTKMGFQVVAVEHEFPATITSDAVDYPITGAFLNSVLFGRKVAPTPDLYIYELTVDGT